eukprot:CAMPEP_0197457850 /NCGR_PEP_ID=MMETSP1175-20131217/47233_1 /TAXON_ID=1003142 /ORGANISM="Triceratium dubium, Strain CCMP147" /LENGTH=82 /DNA_ID=CAMNT_0042992331 /DNA_START=407 /DNA_END=652 /DNA_ORIENTATION=-
MACDSQFDDITPFPPSFPSVAPRVVFGQRTMSRGMKAREVRPIGIIGTWRKPKATGASTVQRIVLIERISARNGVVAQAAAV